MERRGSLIRGRVLFALVPVLVLVLNTRSYGTWEKTFGGDGYDVAFSVQQTKPDGGYIIAGYTDSFGLEWGIYLVKTNSRGEKEWDKSFAEFNGYAAQQTFDQHGSPTGYILGGGSWGGSDLMKTDVGGNKQWQKTLEYGVNSVKQSFDLLGRPDGYIIAGGSPWDVSLIKTDINGEQVWAKTFGGTGNDQGRSVAQTTDGGYIVTGTLSGDVCLIKTDANGEKEWEKTFGEQYLDVGRSVQQTGDGGYIIAGTKTEGLETDVYLIKTDENGNAVWSKTFGGDADEEGYSVQQTTDGGYIIAGSTSSFGVLGSGYVYLIKTDSDGNELWSKIFGGDGYEEGSSVQQTTDGGYIIAGVTDSFNDDWGDFYLVHFEIQQEPRTLRVSAEYKTIQSAIDVASDGDTVLVAGGIYTGLGNKNLDFRGKAITVKSENGPGNCVIDCEGDGRGFYVHVGEKGDSLITGFTITNCNIEDYGGGISCNYSSPTITDCVFHNNTAIQGGGLYIIGRVGYNGDAGTKITNCLFSGNSATGNWNTGGGGLYNSSVPIRITNCTFFDNTGNRGGGIFNGGASPTLINSTLFKNTARTSGGGIYLVGSEANITNSIFWNNKVVSSSQIGEILSTVTVSFSDIQGGYEGEGNIAADPLFVGEAANDFRLMAHSPCIDTGTNNVSQLPDIDLAGNPRIEDGNRDGTEIVDMGAYEYIPPQDSDKDGLPDTLENTTCTDPNDADTDDDGIFDGVEDANKNGIIDTGETDPCQADTDGDGMTDGWEVDNSLDPLLNDAAGDIDQDALDNVGEFVNNTDPNNPDTDGDKMLDGWEVVNNSNPLVDDAQGDADGDGYSNFEEYRRRTDPNDPASYPIKAMPWIPLLLDDR